ncbi:bifunctional DedA family/phosphatase PAP2 family protein [Cohnella yongneupensis]|uniref:Bifunctional DedA family/phosphatase PAP2 family protein n=1 Tax=Cohnella yongneupensis TaxID=425006 RepID=A0ABW0R0J5_9BACL
MREGREKRMSFLSDMITRLLEHYGYVILFGSLLLEMLALPLPGEIIMTYAGLIVHEGKLNWLLSILTGGAGATIGMTIAYWIGYRLGNPFFEKYGSRVHFGPEKLSSLSRWFGRYGNKMLFIAYFIPGVRHLTGYFSGTTRLSFRKYALFAYSGAFFWVSLFITLGKLLGPKWEQYHHAINRYMLIAGLLSASAYLLYVFYKKHKQRIRERLDKWLDKSIRQYHSIGKVKFIIIAAAATFIALFTFMIGLIEDFMADEFTRFDEIGNLIIRQTFGDGWVQTMNHWNSFGSNPSLLVLCALTIIWIWIKGKDRLFTIAFYVAVVVGGEALDEGLRRLFHRIGPTGDIATFPSEHALMALTVFGFTGYLLVRRHENAKSRIIVVMMISLICLMTGISGIYLGSEYASDVVVGYVFGGLWISLNVVLIEIFRMMRRSNHGWRNTKMAT